ncbi:hypothetical protein HCN51_32400 [Nonomuraea sp. FMUSA5-5]|uniref:Protein kinase domain-containing protein n=1 Tax=Nonomuraea composti TaxID=2720023 RepID=A0ABX1BEA7_9ACTN|nr:hypothetical protein [Nonomuraea sp. FMUSA5-5]NJP94084.1 hypothetical protein [Nonomuraea sp. FMUSA5-5]
MNPPDVVDEADLKPAADAAAYQLRPGGQARSLTPCEVAGVPGRLLFKRYDEETLAGLDEDALLAMVRWRRELPRQDRAALDRRCAWPVAAVRSSTGSDAAPHGDGRIVGILIRPAPEQMFVGLRDRMVPRHLDELTRSPDRVEALREQYGTRYYEPPYKLAVLGRLLSTVQWLHERGYVVGDLQLRNAVFTIDPAPAVYLLDCDSCVPAGGRGALPEADPEQWKLPREGAFTPESDYYKLAWALVRCLQESAETWTLDEAALARVLPSRHITLIKQCLDGPPESVDTARWRAAGESWRWLVTPGRIYVETDANLREAWRRGRSAVGNGSAARRGGVVVLIVVLAAIAVVALVTLGV